MCGELSDGRKKEIYRDIWFFRGAKLFPNWSQTNFSIVCDVNTVSDKQRQASLKLHATLQQQQQPKSGVRGLLSRSR